MILIVDDDKAIRQSLALVLKRKGYETALAGNPDEALGMLRKHKFRLVIMDMNYSLSTTGEEGIHLLRQTKIFQPDTPVILITAWGEYVLDSDRNPADFDRCGFIGENPRVKELLKTVERIAPTDAPVLVLGENGTGKELIANAIHKNSRRKNAPFVMVNLGGISTSLFESEMFGHSKGAYTGAVSERKGRFELADKGTIFLDEIGDLTQDCQVKLLRVLQQHTFERLGESRTRKTDIRAICATNADLPAMVREHTFREDLFYRINLITLRIPPLRERRDDIPLLARNFMESASRSHGIRCPEISHEALGYLSRLPYPGNVRQLKNMVERAVLMCAGGILEKCDFEADGNIQDVSATDLKGSLEGATLEDLEAAAIAEAVRKYDGNLSRVAAALGITRQSLYRKIEKHGIDIS